MSNTLKNLITALCITLIAGAGYFIFSRGSDDLTTSDGVQLDSEALFRTQQILADTQQIEQYKLDDAIFIDRRFDSLKDFRAEIADVPTGRSNPFAPVE